MLYLMRTSFTQKEVTEILGISPNTLQGWSRDGLVIPSVANTKGRGIMRLYSVSDLTQIKIVSILSRKSFNRTLIKSLCDHLSGESFKEQAKKLKMSKKDFKASNSRDALTGRVISSVQILVDIHRESLLSPYFDHFGFPLYLILSDDTWTFRQNLKFDSMPGGSTVVLIIDISKIMDEIKRKIG